MSQLLRYGTQNSASTLKKLQFNHRSLGRNDLYLHHSFGDLGAGKRLSPSLIRRADIPAL